MEFINAMTARELDAALRPLTGPVILLAERGSRKKAAAQLLAQYFDSWGMAETGQAIRLIFDLNQS